MKLKLLIDINQHFFGYIEEQVSMGFIAPKSQMHVADSEQDMPGKELGPLAGV